MNSVGYFEIQTDDPARAIEFYSKIFEWSFVKQEGLPIAYWQIEDAGIPGGLLARPAQIPPREHGTNAYTCSIEVSDFDATAQLIVENGGEIAMPKFEIPDKCWQGYFLDADNNTFGIFQAMD